VSRGGCRLRGVGGARDGQAVTPTNGEALAGVDRDLFAKAYLLCRPGTLCHEAELVLRTEEVDWRCEACNAAIPPGAALVCPTCLWPARLAGGDAIVLERIELEVPAHV
jgi:Zn finger protein HypA/HybF involved in hydrogenase expression